MKGVKKKILIVDDDRNLAKLNESFLKLLGYDTRVIHDGATALRVLLEYRPDLIIFDVMMPIMDGYTACRTIVEDPQYHPVPKIIIMTTRDSERDEQVSRLLGAEAFLNKPVEPGELVSKVKELIGM